MPNIPKIAFTAKEPIFGNASTNSLRVTASRRDVRWLDDRISNDNKHLQDELNARFNLIDSHFASERANLEAKIVEAGKSSKWIKIALPVTAASTALIGIAALAEYLDKTKS